MRGGRHFICFGLDLGQMSLRQPPLVLKLAPIRPSSAAMPVFPFTCSPGLEQQALGMAVALHSPGQCRFEAEAAKAKSTAARQRRHQKAAAQVEAEALERGAAGVPSYGFEDPPMAIAVGIAEGRLRRAPAAKGKAKAKAKAKGEAKAKAKPRQRTRQQEAQKKFDQRLRRDLRAAAGDEAKRQALEKKAAARQKEIAQARAVSSERRRAEKAEREAAGSRDISDTTRWDLGWGAPVRKQGR